MPSRNNLLGSGKPYENNDPYPVYMYHEIKESIIVGNEEEEHRLKLLGYYRKPIVQ